MRKCRNHECGAELEQGEGTFDCYCDQNCKWKATRPKQPVQEQQLQLPFPAPGIWGRSPQRHQ